MATEDSKRKPTPTRRPSEKPTGASRPPPPRDQADRQARDAKPPAPRSSQARTPSRASRQPLPPRKPLSESRPKSTLGESTLGASTRSLNRETKKTGEEPRAPLAKPESRELKKDEKGKKKVVTDLEDDEAVLAIRAEVAAKTIDPNRIKLPQFPAPSGERPEALKREEERRKLIVEQMLEDRQEILETASEDEARRFLKKWEAEDKLYYQTDPDDVEVEVYPIKEPHSYVQILRNTRTHGVVYHAIEPRLTREEELVLGFIEETMIDVLDIQPGELENKELHRYIEEKFDEVVSDYGVNMGDLEAAEETRERLLYYIRRNFIGEGPIDILMSDPDIEDVSCDGPHVPIFVYHRRHEALTTTVRFRDHDHLDSFVIRLAQRSQKHVSIAEPILDATMRDGSRLQATLAKEVSSFGSTFTLRKFKEVPFTPIDLVRFGTMSSQMLAFLWLVIEHHMSAIYSGGTASGKTTAINALMMFIPPQNKVITIEDTRELRVPEPNWIAGITRDGFGPHDEHGRQAGEIDMFQLLKNALRQRPEYIVVGEVRGKEAYSLFQAMATGHAAYGTMHADSVDAVIHRLESDPINIPRSLLEALDVVAVQIQTRVGSKRVRRTKQITEVVGLDPNTREILTNEVFTWNPSDDTFSWKGVSYALERIAAESGTEPNSVHKEMETRTKFIEYLIEAEIDSYEDVATWIRNYNKDKEGTLARAGFSGYVKIDEAATVSEASSDAAANEEPVSQVVEDS